MSLTLGGLAALAGIQGVSNLFSNAQQNRYQKQADQRANNFNLAMWNAQNDYNSPVKQMERFSEAGLNPFLIYSQGNAGNASSPPSAQVTPKQAVRFDLMNMVSSALQMQAYAKDIELKDAQIRNVESKTQTDGAKRADMFLDSVRKGQALQARLKSAVAQRRLTYSQVARVRQLIASTEGLATLEASLKREKLNDMLLNRLYGENPLSVKNLPAASRQAAGVFENIFTNLFGWYYNLPSGANAPDEIM